MNNSEETLTKMKKKGYFCDFKEDGTTVYGLKEFTPKFGINYDARKIKLYDGWCTPEDILLLAERIKELKEEGWLDE